MHSVWWWVAGVSVLVLLAVYTVWMAGRIDRSHARAAAAQAALDAHLVRRAAAAAEAAEAAGDSQLRWAARVALEASAEDREAAENDLTRVLRPWLANAAGTADGGPAGTRRPDDADAAAPPPDADGAGPLRGADGGVPLRGADGGPLRGADGAVPLRGAAPELVRTARRVALARQVHNDLVRDALALRRRLLVRVLRLARAHPLPAYFDIDDPAPGRP
jgi:hypothetical protein